MKTAITRSGIPLFPPSLLSSPPLPSVIPALPILSFPPVFSGNPVSFSSVLSFVWPPNWEQPVDSRLKMSGMTEGGLKTSGMTEGD